ncbi:MAG TPA: DUF6263 family protein [Puia sp.]|nr:DUF6263 family protein [Puia sp.]
MNNKFLTAIAFISFALLIACGASSPNNGNTIILKFNLKKGQKFDYYLNMDMNMIESVMGQTMNIDNKFGIGYIFEAEKDSNEWKTITSTINRINMDINAGGKSMKFDTDNPVSDTAGPGGMMSKIFGAMKGGQFTFTMDEKGHVGNVYGMKEMMERMISNLNVPNAEAIMQGMGKSFDESSFKQNIEQSFAIYPDKPIKPGDTWVRTMNIASNGLPVKYENTYTLNSVTGNTANIKVSSKLSSGADSSASGAKDVNGTMTGDMNYDIPTGIPLNGKLNMKMNMKVAAQGQEIPVNMVMIMTTTGKKI